MQWSLVRQAPAGAVYLATACPLISVTAHSQGEGADKQGDGEEGGGGELGSHQGSRHSSTSSMPRQSSSGSVRTSSVEQESSQANNCMLRQGSGSGQGSSSASVPKQSNISSSEPKVGVGLARQTSATGLADSSDQALGAVNGGSRRRSVIEEAVDGFLSMFRRDDSPSDEPSKPHRGLGELRGAHFAEPQGGLDLRRRFHRQYEIDVVASDTSVTSSPDGISSQPVKNVEAKLSPKLASVSSDNKLDGGVGRPSTRDLLSGSSSVSDSEHRAVQGHRTQSQSSAYSHSKHSSSTGKSLSVGSERDTAAASDTGDKSESAGAHKSHGMYFLKAESIGMLSKFSKAISDSLPNFKKDSKAESPVAEVHKSAPVAVVPALVVEEGVGGGMKVSDAGQAKACLTVPRLNGMTTPTYSERLILCAAHGLCESMATVAVRTHCFAAVCLSFCLLSIAVT